MADILYTPDQQDLYMRAAELLAAGKEVDLTNVPWVQAASDMPKYSREPGEIVMWIFRWAQDNFEDWIVLFDQALRQVSNDQCFVILDVPVEKEDRSVMGRSEAFYFSRNGEVSYAVLAAGGTPIWAYKPKHYNGTLK